MVYKQPELFLLKNGLQAARIILNIEWFTSSHNYSYYRMVYKQPELFLL
jgi:hypothetical protein